MRPIDKKHTRDIASKTLEVHSPWNMFQMILWYFNSKTMDRYHYYWVIFRQWQVARPKYLLWMDMRLSGSRTGLAVSTLYPQVSYGSTWAILWFVSIQEGIYKHNRLYMNVLILVLMSGYIRASYIRMSRNYIAVGESSFISFRRIYVIMGIYVATKGPILIWVT